MSKINNKDFTLIDFINNIGKLENENDSFEVTKIVRKGEESKYSSFLKWETSQLDEEEGICPKNCYNCHSPNQNDEDYECKKILLKYYVTQHSTTMEGDSYAGTLVFPLKDHYVFVDYSC